MILMAVAEDQRVDRADAVDRGQGARRRTFAEVEHKPLAGNLEKEARGPLGANTGNQPQMVGSWVHPSRSVAGQAGPATLTSAPRLPNQPPRKENAMKVRNSLKSLRGRHRDNRIVRRKGRVYVINKTQRRFKARQG